MSIQQQQGLYNLRLSISGFGKGISESHHLWTNDLTEAIKHSQYICAWRAAVLSLGCKLTFASVTKAKGRPNAWIAVANPIPGQRGVYTQNVFKSDVAMNTMGAGLMVRYETEDGSWVNPILRGMPDWTINSQDYFFGSGPVPNVLDTAKIPLLVADDLFPLAQDYDYSDDTRSPLATGTGTGNPLNNGFVSFQDALRSYFQAVYQLTCWAKFGNFLTNPDGSSNPLPGWLKYSWENIAIRYVADRRAGLPSGR